MTKEERQIKLETKMYRKKSFGQEDICAKCWACFHYKSCIALPKIRSKQCLCVKAEIRLTNKKKFDDSSPFENTFQDKRVRHYRFPLLGLRRDEV